MYWAKSHGKARTFVYSDSIDFALSAEEAAERNLRAGLVNTVHALARAVDAKDGYTHSHSQRVARYAAELGRALGLPEERLELLRTAGVLHDVGKIGIPDAVLLKPAKLDARRVRRHAPPLRARPRHHRRRRPGGDRHLGPAPARALRRPRLPGRPRRRARSRSRAASCTAPTRSRR